MEEGGGGAAEGGNAHRTRFGFTVVTGLEAAILPMLTTEIQGNYLFRSIGSESACSRSIVMPPGDESE